MNPEIRKMKVEKYGSFLFCPNKEVLCFGTYTPDGSCKHGKCLLEDPAYLKKQKEIKKNMEENNLREQARRKAEHDDPPAQIRRQQKSKIDMLREQVRKKEELAKKLYHDNKPKRGDAVMHEAMLLQGKLRKIERMGAEK